MYCIHTLYNVYVSQGRIQDPSKGGAIDKEKFRLHLFQNHAHIPAANGTNGKDSQVLPSIDLKTGLSVHLV